jgi:hypothetical protein
MVESEPLVEQGASDPAAQPARIEITTDDPIEITVEDNELPLSLDLPTWLVLAASGPALKLAHLLVLLHHQAPADRQITQGLLAALLGKSEDRVAAYTKELVAIGWLTVTKRRVRGWQVPNEYRYRNRPPAGHVTAGTVEDLMAIVDARSSKPAGQPVPAKTRVRTRKNAGHLRNYRPVILIFRSIDRSRSHQASQLRRNRASWPASWSAPWPTDDTECRPPATSTYWPLWLTLRLGRA